VTRVGAFEILGPLGAGGMGEVFRARDTRLNREVALKRLPAAVAADPDRLARFAREAQLLAALNHPNIAQIHGVEDGPGEPGQPPSRALVLELVDGPTLADRIAHGPLPLDEALAIVRQMAEGVGYAHEHGIIHRDLKPANIKLRSDGVVKVLDFGLAKALAPPGASDVHELTDSPTMSDRATAAGTILGTAAYMAPEQARGRAVDRRVDVWALGVMLYEMLTGYRPFGGATVSDTLAAILKDEPDWSRLPRDTPAGMRRVLARLLEKDPRRRLHDINDAWLLLESSDTPEPIPSLPLERRVLPWAAVLLLAALAVLAWRGRAPGSAAPALAALRVALDGPDAELDVKAVPVISPDGTRLLYVRGEELWVRRLDELAPRVIAGTKGATFPFWSPDSREVAYLTSSGLWRASLEGGAPIQIARERRSLIGLRSPGGVWRRDGTIVFAPAISGTSLLVVPADGGELAELLPVDTNSTLDFHRPSLLPDGQSMFVVLDRPAKGGDTIAVVTGAQVRVVHEMPGEFLDSPVYSPTGHLVYHRERASSGVWAVPFSLEHMATTGAPVLIAAGGRFPSIGSNGLLAYSTPAPPPLRALVWVDIATGAETRAVPTPFREIAAPSVSPDGARVAFAASTGDQRGILVADLARQTHAVVAETEPNGAVPTWSDNDTVVFVRLAPGGGRIMARRIDGSQPETELTTGFEPSVSSSTGRLFFMRIDSGLAPGVYRMALPPDGTPPTRFEQTPIAERLPSVSPDGALVAYAVDDGTARAMLRRTEGEGRWQVSATAGGQYARWNPTGSTLYYTDTTGAMFAVDIRREPAVSLSAPRRIALPSGLSPLVGFDVSRDGRRLLMVRTLETDETRLPQLVIAQGWTQ
jgi:Tol biopolymer transport system component/tRNA A-37 threonylcarbamoyl transferase component Bud32